MLLVLSILTPVLHLGIPQAHRQRVCTRNNRHTCVLNDIFFRVLVSDIRHHSPGGCLRNASEFSVLSDCRGENKRALGGE